MHLVAKTSNTGKVAQKTILSRAMEQIDTSVTLENLLLALNMVLASYLFP